MRLVLISLFFLSTLALTSCDTDEFYRDDLNRVEGEITQENLKPRLTIWREENTRFSANSSKRFAYTFEINPQVSVFDMARGGVMNKASVEDTIKSRYRLFICVMHENKTLTPLNIKNGNYLYRDLYPLNKKTFTFIVYSEEFNYGDSYPIDGEIFNNNCLNSSMVRKNSSGLVWVLGDYNFSKFILFEDYQPSCLTHPVTGEVVCDNYT